jgi:hypothetical protein
MEKLKKRLRTQGPTWNETRKRKLEKKKDLWKEELTTLFVILVFEFVAFLQTNIITWSFEKNLI